MKASRPEFGRLKNLALLDCDDHIHGSYDMRNQLTATDQKPVFSQSKDRFASTRTELREAELIEVCGGINPQPLPPRGGDI